MAKIEYVGARERGVVVHLPYPLVSLSRKKGEVTFTKPGDVQEIDAKYASDVVSQGGGQFKFVEMKKKAE